MMFSDVLPMILPLAIESRLASLAAIEATTKR